MFRTITAVCAICSLCGVTQGEDLNDSVLGVGETQRVEAVGNEIDAAAKRIDEILESRWQQDSIIPADTASDAEFCRRVFLDITGVAPPVSQLREFLDSHDPNKRVELIDTLLRSPKHASHMASRWIDILLPNDNQVAVRPDENVAALHRWLQEQFLVNKPYDHLVGGFLTAGGAGNEGPAIFYTSHELKPERIASATSRIFMGIQLQCAQCHDHPLGQWTQEDFWQYAAFFGQLQQRDSRMGGGMVVEDRSGGEVTFPETERVMLPRYPGVKTLPEDDPSENRRRQLTIWMASRDNPFFARAAANRVWGHLFGRGLVDPVDDMDVDNPASHPELLQYLADFLIEQRFDLRDLYAAIGRTKAYGRTSAAPMGEIPPPDSFAIMNVKTLTPAQYFDSMQQNVFRRSVVIASDLSSPDRGQRQQFISRMEATEASPRDYPHGVVQALGLLNGPEVTQATQPASGALLLAMQAPFFTEAQRIETLFLAVLSRRPTDAEAKRFAEYLSSSKDSESREAALGDLLWVLLNTAECTVCP
ncbi:DUF1549 domain-containing protein [Stieleria varia]|uniref:Cytochrome c domain-containing protein n=1 Tax=Stieleria varia TaxID=2528005 RepID=A0A5C6ASA5_9BACT|nr:DUF1549 domain-containing protein [Stieleria varia]TWU02297.1 hypothetical protein Pla52n_33470 [Stieleria varia]